MHLRDAVQSFPLRKLSKLAFPESVALRRACANFPPVPQVLDEDRQQRVSRILASLKTGAAGQLRRRDIRFITSAIGMDPLNRVERVRPILDEISRRRDPRLFRAVFTALLTAYRDRELRLLLSAFLQPHRNVLRSETRLFIERSGILRDGSGLNTMAAKIACAADLYSFCIANGINSRILSSSYGTELKLAVVREVVRFADEESLKRILDWMFDGLGGTPIGDYYEAVLTPFQTQQPDQKVQRVLINRIIEKYKDPRLHQWPTPVGANGESRRDACVQILKRWLTIEYLDLFIDIIEKTAVDRQFKPRKKFWLKYFESNKISDVTLILASDANKIARKMRSEMEDGDYMQWAKLNLASDDQSVLLMRLGDLVIAEWSHNGAMRFWMASDKRAPDFHLKEYVGSQLRNGSIQVKVGSKKRESIIHHENGDWMIWAANAIKHHTGIAV